jgi:glycosyltransferase involved in cell wall biosynthesis
MEGELRQGILIDPDDPTELKSKILGFLNSARWPSLSRQARQIAEKFSWQRYLDGIENCLEDTLAQPRTGETLPACSAENVNRHAR